MQLATFIIKVVFILMVIKIRVFWYYTGCCTGLYPISNIDSDFRRWKEIKIKVSFLPSFYSLMAYCLQMNFMD